MASDLGYQFVSVAVGWELYERTHDPWMLGLVGLAQIIPVLGLTLPAGSVVDRFRRRDVGIAGHAILVLSTFGLAVVTWLGLPIQLIFGLLAITGAARAFSDPAVNAIPPEILKPEHLANSYTWMVSGFQIATIGGPAAAGLLIALTNEASSSYLMAAVAQLIFVVVLFTLPRGRLPQETSEHGVGELFAGVHFIRRNPIYLAAISLDLFAVLLGGVVALLPVFAKDILHVGPAGLGLLRSAPALGALLMALITTRISPWQKPGKVLLVVVAIFGTATIGFGLSQDMTYSLICLFIIGASDSVSMVIRGTLEQVITPNPLRGRVSAVNSLFIGLSNEMGEFESGATAALFGPIVSVVAGGIGTVAVVLLVAVLCPTLRRIGPLHTLRSREVDLQAEHMS
jgi:MFS family permease